MTVATRASTLRQLMRLLPLGLSIGGKPTALALKALDPAFEAWAAGDVVMTTVGPLLLDSSHPSERLLSYAFHNVRRYYRRSPLGCYLRSVRSGTFVDIGANVGMYALLAREYRLATVLVEPEPAHVAFLQRNAMTFGPLVPVALSDAPGELPLYYEPGNPGATSLFPASGYVKGESTVSVDTFSRRAERAEFGNPAAIRLVKIDVEGFEQHVVSGMVPFLDAGHRPAIWCEVRGDASGRNGGSYRGVTKILDGFGYRPVQPVGHGSFRVPRDADLSSLGVFDLLYVPVASRSGLS